MNREQEGRGVPENAGIPGLGHTDSCVWRARETSELKAANYGAFICPAGLERVYLALALR